MYFAPKKDVTYSALIWGTIALVFIILISGWVSDNAHIITDIILIITILFLMISWFLTGYRVESDNLQIQNGLFKTKVQIQEIKKITREKSIMAGPVLAIDRLVIDFSNYKQVHISPKDDRQFLELLVSKNPNIELNEKLLQK